MAKNRYFVFTVSAVNSNQLERILRHELVNNFYEALRLLGRRGLAMAPTIHFNILAVAPCDHFAIVESGSVRQIDPETNFFLQNDEI